MVAQKYDMSFLQCICKQYILNPNEDTMNANASLQTKSRHNTKNVRLFMAILKHSKTSRQVGKFIHVFIFILVCFFVLLINNLFCVFQNVKKLPTFGWWRHIEFLGHLLLYCVKSTLAMLCCITGYFCRGVQRQFGNHVARILLFCLIFGSGMHIAAAGMMSIESSVNILAQVVK